MLVITIFSILILLLIKSSLLNYLILVLFTFIFYLFNFNFFFNSNLRVNLDFIMNDEISLFMTFLLFFIMYVSYISSRNFNSNKVIGLIFISLLFFCFQVFNTIHLFSLYFFYESSLIPIFYIIIKWGSYPERSLSAIIMISYTLIFGVPIFIIIIIIYINLFSWYMPFIIIFKVSHLTTLFIFLCFAVKLPIYGLHYWLPIAHVEAPTFGSVILARILLKLGGVGLYRLILLIDIIFIKSFMLRYFILFTIFRTVVCCFQSDFKRLIAYSSVAHIIVIPFLIIRNNFLSFQSLIIIILFHGLSSTLIFIRVGILYNIYSSRQLILIRGLILISPIIRLFIVLTFFYTLSAPPFPSFIAEIYFIISSYILSDYLVYIFIPFVLLGLVYNINWLRRILFRNSSDLCYFNTHLRYFILLPFILVILLTLFIIPLFMFF